MLLFQDLAAIPILALSPVLGSANRGAAVGAVAALRIVAVIALVVVVGRYLLRPVFHCGGADAVARGVHGDRSAGGHRHRLAHGDRQAYPWRWARFWPGCCWPIPYRHAPEAQLDPFKACCLDCSSPPWACSWTCPCCLRQPWLVGGLVCSHRAQALLLFWHRPGSGATSTPAAASGDCAALAAGRQFAFVVFNLAEDRGLLDSELHRLLVLVITLSMALTPPLVVALDVILLKARAEKPREFGTIDAETPRVIIAGSAASGQIVARAARAAIHYTALENSVEQVDVSRRFRQHDLFGDPLQSRTCCAPRRRKGRIFMLA